MGIVEGSCGNRARGVSIRGKFVLSRNMGYRTRGVAMLLNIVLTPGKTTPKSNFRKMGPEDVRRVLGRYQKSTYGMSQND